MQTILRLIIITALILTAVGGAGYYWLQSYIADALGLNTDLPPVVAVPPDAHRLNHPAYSGPAPWQQQRPAEVYAFPIPWGESGPSDPLFAGPKQYPFLCQTIESELGQPNIDNHQRYGVPVFAEGANQQRTDQIIGYSQDCQLPTRLHYFVRKPLVAGKKPKFERHDDLMPPLAIEPELLVRVESGTINRFVYVLMIPTTRNDSRDNPDMSRWNGKAVYHFKGAVGIGFQQGQARFQRLLRDMNTALEQGFAVLYSTGTETDFHYNAWLQEDTALRVKRQFSSRYGTPEYTIGFGDSGGGLQQYLMAQNHPGLIDGGVAIIAYPDMITQVTYGLDCELLEYYFDHLAPDKAFWQDPEHRSWIEGLSFTRETQTNEIDEIYALTRYLNLSKPPERQGGTECNRNWRGISANANNPHFSTHYYRYSDAVNQGNFWNHWQDNRDFYGTDGEGRGQVPSSNVGVQYGLNAWKNGRISAEQFLDINQKVGSWKAQPEMQQERLWLASNDTNLLRFSPYGQHNMTHQGERMDYAPRLQGSLSASQGAWRSGNVYQGHIGIPIIDVRPYQDHKPDMHHSWSAVSTRTRILKQQGDNRYQTIWMSDSRYRARWDAFQAMVQWLDDKAARKLEDTHIPDYAQDRCLDHTGAVMHQGDTVWNGDWNHQPAGACTQAMPFFQSSRQVAGEDAAADHLLCQLISVDQAIDSGIYAPLDVTSHKEALLKTFPDGVCDYRLPDPGHLPSHPVE